MHKVEEKEMDVGFELYIWLILRWLCHGLEDLYDY